MRKNDKRKKAKKHVHNEVPCEHTQVRKLITHDGYAQDDIWSDSPDWIQRGMNLTGYGEG